MKASQETMNPRLGPPQHLPGRPKTRFPSSPSIWRTRIVRNVTKILLFSPNSLTLITYGLLPYSVCLHCANNHTPLPFSFLSLQFSEHEDKASRFILSGRSRTTILQVLVVIILRTWLCTLFQQLWSLCSVRGFNFVQTS